jgi:hypothetical protein
MRRSESSSRHRDRSEPVFKTAPQHDSTLIQLVMLLACLVPALIAVSSALAQEQAPAAVSTPARVERSWLEPAAPATERPQHSAPNQPATLRLPHEQARPIAGSRGSRIPDLPAVADFDARLVGSFTSSIQPLLLNRCAAGKCHGITGGDTATAGPRFHRQSIRGTVSREMTLANIQALTATVLPDFNPNRLLGPAGSPHGGASLPPLSQTQLHRLSLWIEAAIAQQATWGRVELASFETEAAAPATTPENNRFQRLLDDASNPQPLPPPQEPTGIIPLEDLPEAQPQAN